MIPPAFSRYQAYHTHKFSTASLLTRSIVSFTFDDFPRTALITGGSILRRYQRYGTYYISAGCMHSDSPSGMIAGMEDLKYCVAQGHELACHSFAHEDYSKLPSAAILASMQRNQEAIKAAGLPLLEHFSYPYGRVSLAAKKLAMKNYQSARTTKPGINGNNMDLGMLRAVSLYSRLGMEQAQSYLEKLNKQPGWLIFYTHDVSERPSPYGCTPAELEAILVKVLSLGYDVLPIGSVIKQLTNPFGAWH